jgi:type I restriction enzyme, S subunit
MELEKVKISELGRIVTGKTPPTKNPEYFGDKYQFITPSDMHQGKNATSTERFLSEDGAKLLKNNFIPPGSIAVSCIGWQMGKAIKTTKPSFTNQQLNTIIPNDKVDPDFLYYLLKTKREELFSIASATGVRTPILNKSAFSEFEVSVPNKETQQKIASILSAFDDLIENNTRRIAILEEMARLIYREWFVHYRYPGHENDRLVDSGTEFGEVPEGWGVVRFEEIFDIAYGKTLPTKNLVDNGKYLVYGAGDVIGRYTKKNVDKKLALITCRGNGSGTVWRTRGEGFVTNNSLILNPKSKVQSFFYNYHLAEHSNISSVITGSAQPQITISNLSTLKTVFGNRGVIEQFNSKIEPIYKQIDNLFETNKKLKSTRDLLLPKLISGKINI